MKLLSILAMIVLYAFADKGMKVAVKIRSGTETKKHTPMMYNLLETA